MAKNMRLKTSKKNLKGGRFEAYFRPATEADPDNR